MSTHLSPAQTMGWGYPTPVSSISVMSQKEREPHAYFSYCFLKAVSCLQPKSSYQPYIPAHRTEKCNSCGVPILQGPRTPTWFDTLMYSRLLHAALIRIEAVCQEVCPEGTVNSFNSSIFFLFVCSWWQEGEQLDEGLVWQVSVPLTLTARSWMYFATRNWNNPTVSITFPQQLREASFADELRKS